MLISSRDSILRSAVLVADLVAPSLHRSLEAAYGPGWLELVNASLRASGRRPGCGLEDARMCLVVLAHDPAGGWAHEAWRSMARVLLDLLDSADLGKPVTDHQVGRAFAIAQSFQRGWNGYVSPRTIVVDDEAPGTDGDGLEQTNWFTVSFTRGKGPDAWGDASVSPQFVAADIIWSYWHSDLLEYLRRRLEQGWVPLEPPGPRHLDVEIRWLGMDWGAELLATAASGLTRRFVPSPPERWEAYLVRFRVLLARQPR